MNAIVHVQNMYIDIIFLTFPQYYSALGSYDNTALAIAKLIKVEKTFPFGIGLDALMNNVNEVSVQEI